MKTTKKNELIPAKKNENLETKAKRGFRRYAAGVLCVMLMGSMATRERLNLPVLALIISSLSYKPI